MHDPNCHESRRARTSECNAECLRVRVGALLASAFLLSACVAPSDASDIEKTQADQDEESDDESDSHDVLTPSDGATSEESSESVDKMSDSSETTQGATGSTMGTEDSTDSTMEGETPSGSTASDISSGDQSDDASSASSSDTTTGQTSTNDDSDELSALYCNVRKILLEKCMECHSAQDRDFSRYENIIYWSDADNNILNVDLASETRVNEGLDFARMPIDAPLSAPDRKAIADWVGLGTWPASEPLCATE